MPKRIPIVQQGPRPCRRRLYKETGKLGAGGVMLTQIGDAFGKGDKSAWEGIAVRSVWECREPR
ncbi:hypothetical protein [Verrucomicrobium sp. 3C]|uniref:hypothetical protein n=1 Tax=Verrucomicrobium sp. 3C TaxID=1134055 RepID=UPI0018CA283A|nr:hypothetical protein [Verrucomicrobium sp. 3C]